MARIVFYPFAQVGHVNPTFHLAKQLRARGHDIRYLSLPDIEEHVKAQGWHFTPLFGDLFPKGLCDTLDAVMASNARLVEKRKAGDEMGRRMKAYLTEVLFGSGFEAQLRESQADLLLADATYPMSALTARRLGIPSAIFSITLPLRADALVPPLTESAPPADGWWSRLKVRAARARRARRGRAIYSRFLREQFDELSRRYPELGKLCDFRSHLQHGPYLHLPTLVSCCSEFDFPRASTENLHYIGPCVDLERA
ncbi:MAG: hypothetical protein ACXU86_18745, partial [Archangium sp.]